MIDDTQVVGPQPPTPEEMDHYLNRFIEALSTFAQTVEAHPEYAALIETAGGLPRFLRAYLALQRVASSTPRERFGERAPTLEDLGEVFFVDRGLVDLLLKPEEELTGADVERYEQALLAVQFVREARKNIRRASLLTGLPEAVVTEGLAPDLRAFIRDLDAELTDAFAPFRRGRGREVLPVAGALAAHAVDRASRRHVMRAEAKIRRLYIELQTSAVRRNGCHPLRHHGRAGRAARSARSSTDGDDAGGDGDGSPDPPPSPLAPSPLAPPPGLTALVLHQAVVRIFAVIRLARIALTAGGESTAGWRVLAALAAIERETWRAAGEANR